MITQQSAFESTLNSSFVSCLQRRRLANESNYVFL